MLEQRAIDAAIQGCLDRLNAEYAKHNMTFQADQDKMRLRLAHALRGKISVAPSPRAKRGRINESAAR